MFGTNEFKEVDNPACVPEATNPVVPEPGSPEVLNSYWYPFAGELKDAAKEMVAEFDAIVAVKSVGARQVGCNSTAMLSMKILFPQNELPSNEI